MEEKKDTLEMDYDWCSNFISTNFTKIENMDEIKKLHLLLKRELESEWIKMLQSFERLNEDSIVETYHVCDNLQKDRILQHGFSNFFCFTFFLYLFNFFFFFFY